MIKRLIKSNETESGNLSNDEHEFMRLVNEFPLFDETPEKNFPERLTTAQQDFLVYKKEHPGWKIEDKPYRYDGNISSKTKSHGWNFTFDDENYAALSVDMLKMSRAVLFYKTNKKGKFEVGAENVIETYPMYVDVEAAVDRFCEELFIESD